MEKSIIEKEKGTKQKIKNIKTEILYANKFIREFEECINEYFEEISELDGSCISYIMLSSILSKLNFTRRDSEFDFNY